MTRIFNMDSTIMDRASESLILELLLEDSRNLSRLTQISSRGHDFTLALRLQQEEVTGRSIVKSDRAMCISLDRAVRSDGAQLQTALVEERGALEDRIQACRLGGVELPVLIEAAPIPRLAIQAAPIALPDIGRLAIADGVADGIAGDEENQLVLVSLPTPV
jgi:hypothetical protein